MLEGCDHGKCASGTDGELLPHTCECVGDWTGPLCNEPVCKDGCDEEHGRCVGGDTDAGEVSVSEISWKIGI